MKRIYYIKNNLAKIFFLTLFFLFFTSFDCYSNEIKIENGNLYINNKPSFLYGGDLHYFRVRDKNFSDEKTYEMWKDTLDKMKLAEMNLITTYIPWDYHETAENIFDFTKSKDLKVLLKMAEERNMYVIVKIGPFITAEWPNGFGSFGSVPNWWKNKYTKSLAKKSDKSYFRFFPTDSRQVQPSLLDKQFLLSTEKWYEKVIQEIKPFIGKSVIGIQIDNETNLFWGERYGDIDYSKSALNFYHKWLVNKYSNINTLNISYNSNFKNFNSVYPPNKAPDIYTKFNQDYFKDWYEVGQDYIKTYLLSLKKILENKIGNKKDLFFLVNDSPFGLSIGDYSKNIMLHDTIKKREIANIGIDLYPKQFVFNDELADQPFQADYFTKLIKKLSGNNFVFGTELQGGFYEIPFLGRPKVKAEATDQLLARSIGHGLNGASFYVIRDGINYDNSTYNYDSAITYEGKTTERFKIIKKWGLFLKEYGNEIIKSEEINNNIAILQNRIYQVPSKNSNQNFYTIEYPALYGLLMNININPDLLEASEISEKELQKYKLIFYPNPNYVDSKTAEMLEKYVSNGGTVVNFLNEGNTDDTFKNKTALNKIFTSKKTNINTFIDENLSKEEKEINAYFIKYKKGNFIHIKNNLYHIFNISDYYKESLKNNITLIKKIINKIDEKEIFSLKENKLLIWSRKKENIIFIFIVNDNKSIIETNIKINDYEKLNISKTEKYQVDLSFYNKKTTLISGKDLIENGLNIKIPTLSSQVIILKNK